MQPLPLRLLRLKAAVAQNVNGGYSAGYGDEEWALGWLASLTGDEEVLAVARKHVQNFGRFRFPDTCRYNESSLAAVESTCMRLESAITWRHNKNPGTVSYGGGDAGAFMALNASEPTSIRLAQLWMEHAQAFTLELATDRATSSPHWPDDLADASIRLASFEALAALPPTAHRLPYAQQLSSRLPKSKTSACWGGLAGWRSPRPTLRGAMRRRPLWRSSTPVLGFTHRCSGGTDI